MEELLEKRYKGQISTFKYQQISNFYVTRYMSQTKFRYLLKNKGYLIYNYKLQKYEHINKTPLHHEFKSMQQFKKEYFFKNALLQKA